MNDSEYPLVSVIVPVYNVKPYLNEALDSVINQTYKNLEIIVIDDGSTDGSEIICDEYAAKDSRIRLIHQENQGLSAARNKGLDIMQGTIISFLDSDDAFDSKMIEIMVSSMLQEDADVVICRYATFQIERGKKEEKEMNPILPSGVYDRNTILQSIVEGYINISVWNKIYKVHLWHDIRFLVGKEYEDIANLPFFYNVDKVCIISDALYYYRKHTGSITTTLTIKRFYDWIDNYIIFKTFVLQNVPEIFTEQQGFKVQQTEVRGAIGFYVQLSKMKIDIILLKKIRKEILYTYKNSHLSFRVGCAYQLLRICPTILNVLLPTYLNCKIKTIQKVRQKYSLQRWLNSMR